MATPIVRREGARIPSASSIAAFFNWSFIAFRSKHFCCKTNNGVPERLNQQVLELYKEGKYDAAIPLAERVLAIREKALAQEHPYARLFGICIGYNVAASLGGVMERVSK